MLLLAFVSSGGGGAGDSKSQRKKAQGVHSQNSSRCLSCHPMVDGRPTEQTPIEALHGDLEVGDESFSHTPASTALFLLFLIGL